AALIQSTSGPDYGRWLTATDILKAATIEGAKTAHLADRTGSLEAGKRADLIVLRTTSIEWTPLNDVRKHLVFAENGSSIELVIVDGEVVVRDGRLTTIDEPALLAEVRAAVPAWLAAHAELERRNAVFEPAFAEIHRRATLQDIGVNRYAGDMPAWPGMNRA